MKYIVKDNHYIVRIDRGEEVITKITELCKKENIKCGSIAGLGATNHIKIGLFDTTKKVYNSKVIEGPMEITSLVGNISTMNNEPYLHLHITVGNPDMQVMGGHLNECLISATCELHITKIDTDVDRYFDEEIGLNLYNF